MQSKTLVKEDHGEVWDEYCYVNADQQGYCELTFAQPKPDYTFISSKKFIGYEYSNGVVNCNITYTGSTDLKSALNTQVKDIKVGYHASNVGYRFGLFVNVTDKEFDLFTNIKCSDAKALTLEGNKAMVGKQIIDFSDIKANKEVSLTAVKNTDSITFTTNDWNKTGYYDLDPFIYDYIGLMDGIMLDDDNWMNAMLLGFDASALTPEKNITHAQWCGYIYDRGNPASTANANIYWTNACPLTNDIDGNYLWNSRNGSLTGTFNTTTVGQYSCINVTEIIRNASLYKTCNNNITFFIENAAYPILATGAIYYETSSYLNFGMPQESGIDNLRFEDAENTNGTGNMWYMKVAYNYSSPGINYLFDCATLSSPGNYKLVENNVTSTYGCFEITSSNVVLDCNYLQVKYATTGAGDGINIGSGLTNVTVKNCNVVQAKTLIGAEGIYISSGSSYMNILNNAVIGNGSAPIYVSGSDNLQIKNNLFDQRFIAFGASTIRNSENNSIINNTFISRSVDGLVTSGKANTTITQNKFHVYEDWCLSFNSYESIPYPTRVYDNFFNFTTTNTIYIGGTTFNINFNTTLEEATNVVSNPWIHGNVWYKPDGLGYSQTCTDTSPRDGICDASSYKVAAAGSYYDYGAEIYPDIVTPEIEMVLPLNNTKLNGIVTLQAIASDNRQIGNVTFYYKNATIASVKIGHDFTEPYTTSWNTDPISDDTTNGYFVNATVYDSFGLSASSIFKYYIDHTIPKVQNLSIEYPSGQSSVRNGQTVILRLNTTDGSGGSGMSHVNISTLNLNSSTKNHTMTFQSGSLLNDQWSYWNVSVIVNKTSSSQASVPAYSFDAATPTANTNDGSGWLVRVDNTPPSYTYYSEELIPSISSTFDNASAIITDNYKLKSWLFSSNATGEWINTTATNINTSIEIITAGISISPTTESISYCFYMEDDAGNAGMTPIGTLTVSGYGSSGIIFVPPTPPDESQTDNTSIIFNATINTNLLTLLTWQFNSTSDTYVYNTSVVAHWSFDNISAFGEWDNKTVDLYGTSLKNLTIGTNSNVSPAIVDTPYGKGRYFSGTLAGGYMMLPTNPGIAHNSYWAIEARIKLDKTAQDAAIAGNFQQAGNFDVYGKGIKYQNGYIKAMGMAAGSPPMLSCELTDTTEFHHIFAQFGTNGKLYIDGNLCASGSLNKSWTYRFSVGAATEAGSLSFSGKYFNGTIDEVKVWNQNFTDDEVGRLSRLSLRRYDVDLWRLVINQTKNSTTGLDNGTYAYVIRANTDSYTETRTITIGSMPESPPAEGLSYCPDYIGSGDYRINCSCYLTTNQDIGGNDWYIIGSTANDHLYINATVSNYQNKYINGLSSSSICTVHIRGG